MQINELEIAASLLLLAMTPNRHFSNSMGKLYFVQMKNIWSSDREVIHYIHNHSILYYNLFICVLYIIRVVSYHNNGLPFSVYICKKVHNLFPCFCVEVSCRFISKNYWGFVYYRPCNCNPFLFSS